MEINRFSTQQEEAIVLLNEALSNLTSNNKDLKSILRKCQLVCEILDWEQQKQWFHQELNGYYKESPLPSYRKINGIRKWDIEASGYNNISLISKSFVYGIDPQIYEEKPDTLEVWAGIDWLISTSSFGYRENLQKTKFVDSPWGGDRIKLHRVRIFETVAVRLAILQIEKISFDFASSTYVQLKYSNAIKNIWDDYQIQIDKKISGLGLALHFLAIETNLQSTNSENWRLATFECRNMLNDLANYLWRDTRDRYEYLPGKTDDGKLDVTHGKFGNRLSAYIHQKGIFGIQGKFLREEASRLTSSIQALISVQSEAHDPMSQSQARSVAISTFILLGEIVTRTDLIPIENYGRPVITEDNEV